MIEQLVMWIALEIGKLMLFCGAAFFLYVIAYHVKARLRRTRYNKRVYRSSGKRAR